MKIIVIKDNGEQIESEQFLVAIHTPDETGKDFIAVNGLSDVGILTVCMEILNKVQEDNHIPDPPPLCKDCDDKRLIKHEHTDEECTCGLNFEQLIKENLNAKKNYIQYLVEIWFVSIFCYGFYNDCIFKLLYLVHFKYYLR